MSREKRGDEPLVIHPHVEELRGINQEKVEGLRREGGWVGREKESEEVE
jgi:hypothetical protein